MHKSAKRGTNPSRSFPQAQPPVPVEPVEVSGPVRMLTKKEVLAILGVSYVTLWSWVRDGKFPAPRVMGRASHGSRVGWLSNEVEAALLNAPRRLPKGSKGVER